MKTGLLIFALAWGLAATATLAQNAPPPPPRGAPEEA